MPCPFATLTAFGAVFGASRALFVEDRDARWLARLGLAVLVVGWTAYFVTGRRPELRIALEVVSVLALVAAALRVRWLIRRAGPAVLLPPRVLGWTRIWAQIAWSPLVAFAKTWLLAMVVLEWAGRAHFTPLEYALAVAAVVAILVWRAVRWHQTQLRSALESYASDATPSCPAGFGADTTRGFGLGTRTHASRDEGPRTTPEGSPS